MGMFSLFKSRRDSNPIDMTTAARYIAEYVAAIDRTQAFGFDAPPRIIVQKDCVDMDAVRPVLLDYFERHEPQAMIGQTLAINIALVPLLYDKTGIHFNLTVGWMVRKGKPIFQHDDSLIRRFVERKGGAWRREGCPFHLWLTSPACEVLDVTFAMNLGWAKTREQCAALIVYQPAGQATSDSVYHPMLVGPDFFYKTGAVV